MKTVYKDLLKHDGIKKKRQHRKTANGTYDTVLEYPEESDNDSCDSVKETSDMDNDDGDVGHHVDSLPNHVYAAFYILSSRQRTFDVARQWSFQGKTVLSKPHHI